MSAGRVLHTAVLVQARGTDQIRAEIHSKGFNSRPRVLASRPPGRRRPPAAGDRRGFCQEETHVLAEQFSSGEHDAFCVPHLSDTIREGRPSPTCGSRPRSRTFAASASPSSSTHERRSRRYGDIRKALLSAPAVADADRSLPVPASPHDWLAEHRFALDEGLRRLAAAARAGATTGGSIEDSVLRVERTETAVPDGAADLVADLYRRLPEARITDILLEVDDATRFTEAFTHLRTGEPCRDRIGLLNVLLAEGINLGLRKMAEATTTHGFWELMRVARWHVEGDAFDRALAVVVEAQAALPMAAFWGTGRTASSDGQFVPAGGRDEALNLVNARYGAEPGVKAYSHISDRFSPFATQTIPATVHEAPYILDGLLMNETGRRVREQYADTGGFTDHVFAACSILGYAFVPRIRDLPSKRLYVFERAGVPKRLRPLVGGKVNADLIDRNWADILRVASTMAAGTMRPSQPPAQARRVPAPPRRASN